MSRAPELFGCELSVATDGAETTNWEGSALSFSLDADSMQRSGSFVELVDGSELVFYAQHFISPADFPSNLFIESICFFLVICFRRACTPLLLSSKETSQTLHQKDFFEDLSSPNHFAKLSSFNHLGLKSVYLILHRKKYLICNYLSYI